MAGTLINNPIAWAHFKVRGGWRNHLWSTGLYCFAILAGIILSTHLNPMGSMLAAWTTILLVLQMALLILFGCNVIGNSIRRDITSGLLESHRLMPIPASAAIVGYITGPTFQTILLAAANFIIGTTLAGMTGTMDQWLMCNVIVTLFVLFLWVGIAFTTFIAKNAFGILSGLTIFAFIGNRGSSSFFDFIPAIRVVMTPMLGESVIALLNRSQPATIGYAWGFLAQLVFGAIFFRGAMRRYRRDDLPALSVLLGLMLLAAWVGTSAVGIVRFADFHPAMRGRSRSMNSSFVDPEVLPIAALLTSMLIGITAIASSARSMTDWTRTLIGSGRQPGPRPLPPPLIAILATAITLPIVAASPPEFMSPAAAFLRVGIALLAFFLSISYLLRIFYRAGRKAFALVAIWVIATWLIPFGLDALRPDTPPHHHQPLLLSLASPWGTFVNLWDIQPSRSFGGLAFQALLASGMAALFYSSEPKLRPQPIAAPVQ